MIIEEFNKWLGTQGVSLTGEKIYRLSWSEDLFENRHGLFRDFTTSGLFIREVIETRKVKKYNYIKERFILEKWAPGNLTANPETPDAINGDYICVYVFEDKKGNYLTPTRRSLEFLINYMQGRVPKDEEIDPRIIEEKEVKYIEESFQDVPDFRTTGVIRDSVAYTRGLRGIKDFKEIK